MKISNLLLLSLIIAGCNSAPENKITDNRPATQLALIKKFNTADSLYFYESNDIKKTEALENGKTELIKFITDSLHDDVKQWPAVVHEISVDKLLDYIDVTLNISKKMGKYEDPSEFKVIILHSKVSMSDTTVKNQLKKLLTGDQIFVNGSFEKDDIVGDINFHGNNYDDRDIFSSPELNFKIKSITKQTK
ncbi:hypothetical protein SAMN05428975_1426 [Mucilaginibacter sp. OK268]|uniref:hypothetical protein n=1 Tax=Mucilaginibacter sp. OK268 TaxID=1881048 RepID=UPI00087EFF15|nr:hypothetical protein [Mucilaginibacter sp. OK268]SDP48700.1 hypothetical protein SAMN05428975_1426 [Mucilaginibacter sp. OK268]